MKKRKILPVYKNWFYTYIIYTTLLKNCTLNFSKTICYTVNVLHLAMYYF